MLVVEATARKSRRLLVPLPVIRGALYDVRRVYLFSENMICQRYHRLYEHSANPVAQALRPVDR